MRSSKFFVSSFVDGEACAGIGSDFRPNPNQTGEDLKLVAAEEAGTEMRGQHCSIAAWTHEKIKPAFGQMQIVLLPGFHEKAPCSYYSGTLAQYEFL
jgi:hypothetical protein